MIPFLVRELTQRRSVTILCYHRLSPATADRHLLALTRRYSVISLREYIELRKSPGTPWPRKALILTFDDGHRDHLLLKPLLEKHGAVATTFICSGITGTNRHFWFEAPMSSRERARLKGVPDEERLRSLEQIGFSETREFPERQALSWEEIEDMDAVVDFQSHTVFHPILPRCSDARSAHEIVQSKVDLERRLGQRIYAIAYPNGDYSSREIAFAREAGYDCALTLDFGFNNRTTPMFRLKRICITDDAGTDELLVRASGVWDGLKRALYVAQRTIGSESGRRLWRRTASLRDQDAHAGETHSALSS